ncbi:MAG: hypothetical protein M3P70_12670 [Actinomycetota bacterium]|nr:hypothetical protein [Actinomycetota bacterium]
MLAYGAGAEVEPTRNLGIGHPLGYEAQDLELALRRRSFVLASGFASREPVK